MISCLHVFFRLQSVVCSFVPYTLYFNSGGSRPWAKGGVGGGRLCFTCPAGFSPLCHFFFFLPKIRETKSYSVVIHFIHLVIYFSCCCCLSGVDVPETDQSLIEQVRSLDLQ